MKTLCRPLRVEDPNGRYFSIYDSNGERVCDFFPEARDSLPREALLEIANRFVERENENGE